MQKTLEIWLVPSMLTCDRENAFRNPPHGSDGAKECLIKEKNLLVNRNENKNAKI